MTEKRFTYEYDKYDGNLFDNKMNTFYHIEDSEENIELLCNRLNWLVEMNEQLKDALNQRTDQCDNYYKENEQLKSTNGEMEDYLARLEEENEQLRKQNQELIQGIQETAKISANGITKPMVEKRWGKGVDYD